LAKQGTAGQNYRVVYGENETGKESWLYYYETQSPTLTQILTCNTFTLPKFSFINFPEQQMSPYYLIPIIFTIFFIFLFTILIITARLIDKRQNRKQKKAEVKG